MRLYLCDVYSARYDLPANVSAFVPYIYASCHLAAAAWVHLHEPDARNVRIVRRPGRARVERHRVAIVAAHCGGTSECLPGRCVCPCVACLAVERDDGLRCPSCERLEGEPHLSGCAHAPWGLPVAVALRPPRLSVVRSPR